MKTASFMLTNLDRTDFYVTAYVFFLFFFFCGVFQHHKISRCSAHSHKERNRSELLPVLGLKTNCFYEHIDTPQPHAYTYMHTFLLINAHIFLQQPGSPKAAGNKFHFVCPAAVFPLGLM